MTSDSLSLAAAMFNALGNNTRLAIMLALSKKPCCVHDIVHCLDASQPTVSQHLRILRAADLVETTRKGREIIYAVKDQHVARIVRDAIKHAQE